MISRPTSGRAAWAALAVTGLALAGCTGSSDDPDGETDASAGILSVYGGASGQFVENYNPFSPTVLSNVQGMIYEPLFFFNNLAPLDTPAVPILGESYEFNEDGTVLTVTLQQGVEWSDGEPVTAEDVAFSFNLVRDNPELDTTGNAPAAEVVDDSTVTLTFERPSFTDGPSVLGSGWIVPEHVWADVDDPVTNVNADPVGSGPLTAGDFTAQSYVLERNENYRDADSLAVDGIRLLSLSGNQAATDQLLTGQLDWAGIFIPDVENVLAQHPDVAYGPTGSQQVVLTTCSNTDLGCTGPQTSQVVRQAISAAIDRNQVNQLAYYGLGTPISPTFAILGRDDALLAPEYADPLPETADVEAAQALLEGDGWELGSDGVYAKDGERLSMDVGVTSGYTDYIAALDVITEQLAAAGIEINVGQAANAEILDARGRGQFEIMIDGVFQGPVADPYYVYNTIFNSANTAPVGESGNPYGNVARFSDPDVDAAIAEAGATEDLEVKAEAYQRIHDVVVEDLPYIPIVNNPAFAEYSTATLQGWPTADDQYAPVGPGGVSAAQILLRLQPAE